TAVRHDSVESSLRFYGAAEIMHEPISEKGLQFKLERHIRNAIQVKARKASAKKAAESATNDEQPSGADSGVERESQLAPSRKVRVIRGRALNVESDFWLTEEIEAKRIRDRWIVR